MKHITVEITFYPLADNYKSHIRDFLCRLNMHHGLEVITNKVSTQIVGEHKTVFEILSKEIDASFSSIPSSVFILKILGVDRKIHETYPEGKFQ